MTGLSLDEVKTIGIAAIRRVIGNTFTDADFEIRFSLDGEPEYSFWVRFPTPDSWRHASSHVSDITDALMEDLALRGDDSFPYVWLLSDGSWTFSRDAAAE